ncbi:MAG: hypothetical protein ACLFTQ_01870 [Candidatus Aenigmatarchaeota archaeon]
MVNRKGFVYIMEVVLISIIIIVSLSFILAPLDIEEDWRPIKLRTMGESAVETVDRNVTIEAAIFNESVPFEDRVDELLYRTGGPEEVRYNLRVENSYRTNPKVGFNCTGEGCLDEDDEEEHRGLWELLGRTWMNRRFIQLWEGLERIDWREFRDDEIYRNNFDVVFLRGENQTERANKPENREELEEFVREGGGVVQFSNFTEVKEMDIQKEIFNLTEDGSGGGSLELRNVENVTKPNYEPAKLFHGVGSLVNTGREGTPWPEEGEWVLRGEEYVVEVEETGKNITVKNETGYTLCKGCIEGDSFELEDEEMEDDTFKIRKIYIPEDGPYRNQTVAWFNYPEFDEEEKYIFEDEVFAGERARSDLSKEFEVTVDGDGARMVINELGEGRAVWVSENRDGEEVTGEAVDEDIQSLVQAGVIWASPRGEWVKESERDPDRRSPEILYFGSINDEIYEPYKLSMNIWYTY